MSMQKPFVLIVDDMPQNLQLLGNLLRENGYKVAAAKNGRIALAAIQKRRPDCILLDIMMPEMDGFETCRRLKAMPGTQEIPVIFITAQTGIGDKLKAFALGGVDYITKPFQAEEVLARVTTHLRLQELQRRLQRQNALLEAEKQKSDALLLNILPPPIADELKRTNAVEPRYFDSVSVLFTDFVGFTHLAERLTPEQLIEQLDHYFTVFDSVVERYGLEKLKTIGDSYMCAGGIPTPSATHAVDIVRAALDMQAFFAAEHAGGAENEELYGCRMRLGIHTGPLMAGVVGRKKFVYDVWGDTVNLASRLESSGVPGKVNISKATYDLVNAHFECEYRGKIAAKHKGDVDMYLVHAVDD